MRAEDYRRALQAVVAAREWVDARIAELPDEAGQVDVMALADRGDAPGGLVVGLGVLGALAMLPPEHVGQLSRELSLQASDALWLSEVSRRLRQLPGMAEAPPDDTADAKPGERPDLENPILEVAYSPEFYVGPNLAAMTIVLKTDSGVALRVKEPVTGHMATAGMLIDYCARTYELCRTRGIGLSDEELTDVRGLLTRTLRCIRRICDATGTPFDDVARQVDDTPDESGLAQGSK
jgi:hypothetical protein